MPELTSEQLLRVVTAVDEQRVARLQATADAEWTAEHWLAFGQIQRRRGALDAAATSFARAAQLGAGDEARYLAALCWNRAPAIARRRDRSWPGPFVHTPQFLAEADAADLLRDVVAEEAVFTAARTSGQTLAPTVRRAAVATLPAHWRDRVRNALLSRLPSVLPMLGIEPFEIHGVRSAVICSRDGDFYRAHRDDDVERAGRVVSFVLYLHHQPKVFTGGDLLIRDSAPGSAHDGGGGAAFTRVVPTHNSAIFFPSDVLHEVTTIHMEDAPFGHSRFSIACWIYGPTAATPGSRADVD